MTKNASARIPVARVRHGAVELIGEGVLVSERIVLVPLSLSGPLRPRVGVVVLTGTDPKEQVPVVRIHRSVSTTGDVLGLELAAPVSGPVAALPTSGTVEPWLEQSLAAEPSWAEAPGELDGLGPRGPMGVRPSKSAAKGPICRLFPWLCR